MFIRPCSSAAWTGSVHAASTFLKWQDLLGSMSFCVELQCNCTVVNAGKGSGSAVSGLAGNFLMYNRWLFDIRLLPDG